MNETYYIFKEEDLKCISGPVQQEWDKPAIFKQDLLDICKKITIDDEKSNDSDNFDACSMDVDEAMRIHQEFSQRINQWLHNYGKELIEKEQKAIDTLKEENHKMNESVSDIKAPVPSYNIASPAIFSTCFHGETWYKCPHCMNYFEIYEIIHNKDAITDKTGVYICPKCKKQFKL